ncbi:squamosa promoter-binding-like protein 1 [Tasmannia lanceolata]|uniref:squamosa promoter-binding-like protein 1 n=1 Tax=Tasmannia lanceolata TaxID=3420 RepID=UPI0040633699
MVKGKQLMLGEHNHEWNSNEWKWDSNLFIAERLNTSQSFSNCIQLLPNDTVFEDRNSLEKRRKVSVVEENGLRQEDGLLSLKLGENIYQIVERDGGNDGLSDEKRFKAPPGSSKPPFCQVDACYANLNDAKDYHRRHKVCEMHAKSGNVLLGGVLQRFCQQCSRFHMLQEFDEEKRSCRRRLAGHNLRRRKNNPDTVVNDHPLRDDRASRYILLYLLRILSNLHSNNSDQSKDQDLLFQILGMISSSVGTSASMDLSELIKLPQPLQSAATFAGVPGEETPTLVSSPIRGFTAPEPSVAVCSPMAASLSCSSQDPTTTMGQSTPTSVPGEGKGSVPSKDSSALCPEKDEPQRQRDEECPLMVSLEAKGGETTKTKLRDFDLNIIYNEFQDHKEGLDRRPAQNNGRIQAGYSDFSSCVQRGVHQTSPAPTSGNSESTSQKSVFSSGEDVGCRTDRIIFKLFGKGPNDLPHVLRAQILNWLSHSPTDIESYIRPGCLVLTIYLRLSKNMWEELCGNLTSSLKRLLEASANIFWRTGWICAQVGHKLAFIHDGQVLLDTPLPRSQDTPFILSVTPVAVALSTDAIITVKGTHLTCTTTKLRCAFHGNLSVYDIASDLKEKENGSLTDCFEIFDGHNNDIQTLSFPCSVSNMSGRGFIEVEDHDLSSGFLPFIVTEDDICSELHTLESSIEVIEVDNMRSRDQIIEFLHEFGWLLERSHLSSRSDLAIIQHTGFSNVRFKWLLEFSVERDWCAVVRKILNILFDRKVGGADYSVEELLDEVCPLHRAVRRNCGSMVEFLLKYNPKEEKAALANPEAKFRKKLFVSNRRGPRGITPLHIAASMEGADGVLNLLTDQPEQDWLQTWENSRDETGFTPKDYARQRGHDCYIQLVQRKKSNKTTGGHLILDMSNPSPTTERRVEESLLILQGNSIKQNQVAFNIDSRSKEQGKCRLCEQLSVCRSGHRALRYRPAILSMVAIAAVCVCVGILFKTPPEVLFVVGFRWEQMDYGYI